MCSPTNMVSRFGRLSTLTKVQSLLGQPVPSRNDNRARRTERMKEERRLVWRVLRRWTEISDGGRFPRRDQIDPWMRGEDGTNYPVARGGIAHRAVAFRLSRG